MSDTNVVETFADDVKSGRRHSKQDLAFLTKLREIAKQLESVAADLGVESVEDVEDAKETPRVVPALSVAPTPEKALSLDEQVQAVREVFYAIARRLRQAKYPLGGDGYVYDEDFENSIPACLFVYPDYAIVRVNNNKYRVDYTWGDTGVILPDQSTWQMVEQDWTPVVKSWDGMPGAEFAVKALGDGRLGMYAVVWGDKDRRDLSKEYFTRETQDLETIFKAVGKLPLLYHHAMDETVKTDVVGLVDTLVRDDVGLWAEAVITRANRYADTVYQLGKRGLLGPSSGTLPGARKVVDGEIKRWAMAELSLTPEPCEWRMRTDVPPQELKAIFTEAGLSLPEDAVKTDQGVVETRPEGERALEAERELLSLLTLSIEGDV